MNSMGPGSTLVIGAGLSGLATAHALTERGLPLPCWRHATAWHTPGETVIRRFA
jgi:cation diffusion facilitator CzcD-associated flavoprotein CzcO